MVDEMRDELLGRVSRGNYRRSIDAVLRVYSALGVLFALLGFGYFGVSLLPFGLSPEQRMSLIIGGVGVSLAVLSRLLSTIRKEREVREADRLQEYERHMLFLSMWNRFEAVSRFAAREFGDAQSAHVSIRSLIRLLAQKELLSPRDVEILELALRIRNELVHGASQFSERSLDFISEELQRLTEMLGVIGADELDPEAIGAGDRLVLKADT